MQLKFLGNVFPQRDNASFSNESLPGWARIHSGCPIIETQVIKGQCGPFKTTSSSVFFKENPPKPHSHNYDLEAYYGLGKYPNVGLAIPYTSRACGGIIYTSSNVLTLVAKDVDSTVQLGEWEFTGPTNVKVVGWIASEIKYKAPTRFIDKVIQDMDTGIIYVGNDMFQCDCELGESKMSDYKRLITEHSECAFVIRSADNGLHFFERRNGDDGTVNGDL